MAEPSFDPPVEMDEPWPCRHVGGEGCEGCDSRGTEECPNYEEEVMPTHERFNRKVYAFKDDFTGSLAKWLVKQSPYVVPDNLSGCIIFFEGRLDELATFDTAGLANISLSDLKPQIEKILESIPMIMALNEKKKDIQGITDDPDSDFIDIGAVAGNIVCDFAERADAECWLDRKKDKPDDPASD